MILLASASAIANEQTILRVGGSAESIYDTKITDVEILISLLFNEMFAEQDKQLKIKIYESDQMLSDQLVTGKLDAAFMNPLFYLDHVNHLNKDVTFAVRHGPTIKPKYVLLVRQDSNIDSLDKLRNKRLIVPSGHIMGKRFLDVELLRSGLPISEEIFSEIRYTGESNAAIINLFFGQVDAALVTDFSYEVASELNRQIPQTLQAILTSKPLVHMLISVRKGLPSEVIEKVLPFADVLHQLPRLKYLQKTFRFEGVIRINNDDLHDIDILNSEYSQLKSKSLTR
ncbi:MAG: PhnD/SsuA/transferrin family substrate-binding protein [Candidatus Thiodiazotropha sp.]